MASRDSTYRRLSRLLALAFLALGLVGRAPDTAGTAFAASTPAGVTPEMIAAAKKEGEVNYYTSNDINFANKLKAAFEKKYEIKVNVLRMVSGTLYSRILQEFDTGINAADVVETTVMEQFSTMKARKILQPFRPASINLYGRPGYHDGEHYWHATRIATSTINYNQDLLKGDMVPKTWKDLTDPKYKDKIVQGHPRTAGASAAIFFNLVKLYGWDYFEALKRNNVMTQQSCVQPNLLASGERLLVPCDYPSIPLAQAQGLPLAAVFPQDGVFLILAPAGVLAKAPHPNAAKLLFNWLTSVEGQNHYAQAGFLSTLDTPDLKYPASFPDPKRLKLIESDPDEVKQWWPEGLKKFAELFGG